MKKIICLILALALCFGCVGCGGSGSSPKADAQTYAPGVSVNTEFGSVAVVDAAFCAKAQIYYTRNSITHRTTVNGQTTESYEENIFPGYITTMENKLVFALKTVMTNTTDNDLELHKLQVTARFGSNDPVYFSKGGNYEISDPAYKILPAGGSAEVVLAALVPVEQYQAAADCLLEVGGAKLSFDYDSIRIYNALGYQEGDNTPVAIEEVIQVAAGGVIEETQPPAETEPEVVEPEVHLLPGYNIDDGSNGYEGKSLTYYNVGLGFLDQLPAHLLEKFSHYAEELTMNETQCYAVVRFIATNKTKDTVDLADLHGDFMVQLNYNNGYVYNTHNDVKAIFESGGNIKMVQKSFSTGNDISISPLASAEVTVYLACAKEVAENTTNPLYLGLVSRYEGNETATFGFPRNIIRERPAVTAPAGVDALYPYIEYDANFEGEFIEVYDCRMYDLGDVTRFEVDYKTAPGLIPCVFANFWEDNIPDYWYEADRTTGQTETLVFEMDTELLYRSAGPDVHFRRANGDLSCYVLIYHLDLMMTVTDGAPEGKAETLEGFMEGDIQLHDIIMQPLDNGYVRFSIECTPPADRWVSFFSPPNGESFMFCSEDVTTGDRQTITLDVKKDALIGVDTITMKFYIDGDEVEPAWIWMSNPLA